MNFIAERSVPATEHAVQGLVPPAEPGPADALDRLREGGDLARLLLQRQPRHQVLRPFRDGLRRVAPRQAVPGLPLVARGAGNHLRRPVPAKCRSNPGKMPAKRF
eukprot:gene1487-biopygen12912